MKVLERAAGHSCGPYRVPAVDVEAKTVYTNNPPCGAMRGFGANQASFAIEGVMDLLAEEVGIDGYDIRERNILAPGDRFATGQVMTASCGIRQTLEAVRDAYKEARHAGIGCGIKNTGIGNGMDDSGRVLLRALDTGRLESSPDTRRWDRACSPFCARSCTMRPACRSTSWMSAPPPTRASCAA